MSALNKRKTASGRDRTVQAAWIGAGSAVAVAIIALVGNWMITNSHEGGSSREAARPGTVTNRQDSVGSPTSTSKPAIDEPVLKRKLPAVAPLDVVAAAGSAGQSALVGEGTVNQQQANGNGGTVVQAGPEASITMGRDEASSVVSPRALHASSMVAALIRARELQRSAVDESGDAKLLSLASAMHWYFVAERMGSEEARGALLSTDWSAGTVEVLRLQHPDEWTAYRALLAGK